MKRLGCAPDPDEPGEEIPRGTAEQVDLRAKLASDPDWWVRVLATGDAAVLASEPSGRDRARPAML